MSKKGSPLSTRNSLFMVLLKATRAEISGRLQYSFTWSNTGCKRNSRTNPTCFFFKQIPKLLLPGYSALFRILIARTLIRAPSLHTTKKVHAFDPQALLSTLITPHPLILLSSSLQPFPWRRSLKDQQVSPTFPQEHRSHAADVVNVRSLILRAALIPRNKQDSHA